MSLEKLGVLEERVRGLVDLAQSLRREKASLEAELRKARERLLKHEEESQRWELERADIKTRIEKVLDELDVLECVADTKEVALD